MKRMPPDPERLAQYQRVMREFAENPPYPVHGLRRPVVVPAYLAEWETEEGEIRSVQLRYGDGLDFEGPFVAVTTGPPGSAALWVDPLVALKHGIRGGELPRTQAAPVYAQIPQGELCRLGGSWALRMVVGDQEVTVVGRGLAPEDVEVGRVDDLLPYVTERNALFARIAAERRALPDPELAPASGIAAVRAFLETFLPGGPDAGAAYRALSRRAVAEFDAVRQCGRERAEYLVYSMVNQLSHLRDHVAWFTEPDGPRAAALEELLRHVGLDQPVDSEVAQARWAEYWEAQQEVTDRHSRDLRDAWAAAWVAWAEERSQL